MKKSTMQYQKSFNRRTLLRGAGSIAIGLPFLDGMQTTSVWGATAAPPMRAVTFFFGLGVRPEHAAAGLTGPLSPLAPFASKVGFSKNLNLGTSTSSANHDVGSEFVFRGVDNKSATIDQFVLEQLHGGQTPTAIRSLIAGTYSRNNGKRENHSYRSNGGVTDSVVRVPQTLFDRVFGQFDPGKPANPTPVPPQPGTCEADKMRHIERSILDSVSEQYKFLSSDAGNLGAGSRAQLSDHMDKIRELELTVFGESMQTATAATQAALNAQVCGKPERPGVFDGQNFNRLQTNVGDGDVGNGSDTVPIAWSDWDKMWRTMADVYAMALICDRSRFGNLQFMSGGDRVSIKGNYSWGGRSITFDDPTTSHEYWHGWGGDVAHGKAGTHKSRDWVEKHTHLLMSRAAYFMGVLDGAKEGNGKSVLENMLFLMSTELGDGGDSHSLRDIFHLWTSASGKLKVGAGIDFAEMDATKLYNTIAKALTGKTMTLTHAPDATSMGWLVA